MLDDGSVVCGNETIHRKLLKQLRTAGRDAIDAAASS
jgi:hypothetical protein